ncbi:MAG: hypothetical protein LBH00_08560 [Planctomycetaceae bacterium]|jgi:hypothetical protein|nr:hypothetical protein [Planctomycetaceae bacterium]
METVNSRNFREHWCGFCAVYAAVLLLFAAVFCGCSAMPAAGVGVWNAAGPATTVFAVWDPAVSNENGKPVRGFGGRVYFYDQNQSKPVKVDGTVVVYAFSEDGRDPSDTKPNEGFVFDTKMLNSKEVYKKSKLGHSYNLWIPWDYEGPDGKAKKVSLIVRYIPKKGSSVVSAQATAYLPGKRDPYPNAPNTMLASGTNRETIQQVSLAEPSDSLVPVLPAREKLTEEREIEINENHPQTMQTISIK